MNKLILILITLFSANIFAAPAKTYQCTGVEIIDGEAIAVNTEINYSDWIANEGYTKETVSISPAVGSNDFSDTEVNLEELRSLAAAHDCVSFVEIEPQDTSSGYQFLKFEFNFNCNSDGVYKLETYCEM